MCRPDAGRPSFILSGARAAHLAPDLDDVAEVDLPAIERARGGLDREVRVEDEARDPARAQLGDVQHEAVAIAERDIDRELHAEAVDLAARTQDEHTVEVVVDLGSIELPLSRLTQLQVGDVILLNKRIDEPIVAFGSMSTPKRRNRSRDQVYMVEKETEPGCAARKRFCATESSRTKESS